MPYSSRRGFRAARSGGRMGSAGPKTWAHMQQCVEKKFHDGELASELIGLSAAASIDSILSGIAQGTTAETRIGTKAFVWSAAIRGKMQLIQTAGGSFDHDDIVRVLLVVDKQSNGTTPAIQDVLATTGTTADIHSFRNLENMNRFVVLSDNSYVFNVQAAAGDGVANDTAPVVKRFSLFKTWKTALKVVYDTTDTIGTTASIKDNNIWLMAYSEHGARVVLEYQSRLRYTD